MMDTATTLDDGDEVNDLIICRLMDYTMDSVDHGNFEFSQHGL